MKNTRPESSRVRAFTLIELLTVIAIIGILAAILIPTVKSVRSRATMAQCASNLHQLGVSLTMYRNDNKGVLPDGTIQNPNLQWIATTLRDDLKRYGMAYQMLYCNGNAEYRNANMTEANRTKVGGNGFPIGYIYLPGTTYTFVNQNGTSSPSNYKELREARINYRLIAADLNRQYNGSWNAGMNHSDNTILFGGNHLYIDGAVKWHPASAFSARPALSGNGSDYYFKTEDAR